MSFQGQNYHLRKPRFFFFFPVKKWRGAVPKDEFLGWEIVTQFHVAHNLNLHYSSNVLKSKEQHNI